MKWLIVFCVILNIKVYSLGQTNFYVSGGVNYCKLLPDLISSQWKDFDRKYNKYAFFYNYGIGFLKNIEKFQINSGVNISERGTKVNFYAPDGSDHYFTNYTFLELPLVISYKIYNKFSIGIGIQPAIRLGSNLTVVGEINQNKCLDLKLHTTYFMSKRFSLSSSYIYGNFDKLIFKAEDTYLHSVFALNINYHFWILRAK